MSLVVNDSVLADELIKQRQAMGGDRYDEVWDGVYMMSPIANNEHQGLATSISTAIVTVVDWKGLGRTLCGANISDRREGWTKNYRVPDVLVFMNDCSAEDCGSHWCGGPDLAIEIVSEGDRTLEKLDFYAQINTRELLVIDRDPWQLTLYRRSDAAAMTPVAVSSFTQSVLITSQAIPVQFQLVTQPTRLRVQKEIGELVRDITIAT